MTTKKGDFVEVLFVGKEKESGKVFDTNDAVEAKKLKLDSKPEDSSLQDDGWGRI